MRQIKEIPVADVKVGPRHRKDMGDLKALAASIKKVGLLHPIGVTKAGELIFGERRLKAVHDLLGWDKIPAVVIDLESLMEAERDENEIRKDFTIEERVEIGKAVEERIGNRQGQRTDLQPVGKIPQVEAGQKTRDAAAETAGVGDSKTYRKAKKVFKSGAAELRQAVNDKDISISAAAKVAELPESKQREVVQEIRSGVKPKAALAKVQGEDDKPTQKKPNKQPCKACGGRGWIEC